ncbi:MAG TPA: helix-turn-helix domain-containing protein [Gaiellaceae bacterium]|nr:helix-turn-helix domain-containing protein [Gaiellaceae bacterium]
MSRLLRVSCRYSPVIDRTKARLLTSDQVAERLGVARNTVHDLVKAGRLPAIQFVPGGRLKFRPSDVEALCTPNVGAAA